jgi:5'-3' exonuclease
MTSKMMESQKDKIAVWDADFIPFYVCYNKKDEPIKSLEDCKALCDSMIDTINISTRCNYYTGYLTVGKCFRYEINPSYKANRKYGETPPFIAEIKDYLKTNHNFLFDTRYEADDLVLSFKAQNPQYECVIISPDKDVLNLYEGGYNPRLNQFKYTSKEEAEKFFWGSMIIGDRVDGIPGIPGMGKKAVEKLFDRPNITSYMAIVQEEYCKVFGEYEGIKEFTRNYLSLKLVDNVKLEEVKLNKIDKLLCE